MADSCQLLSNYLAASSVINILLGIGCVFFFLRSRREKESHMRQMSILYNNYMSSLDKLKNVSSVKEGHTINPAFDLQESPKKHQTEGNRNSAKSNQDNRHRDRKKMKGESSADKDGSDDDMPPGLDPTFSSKV